jgi:hypothetical protein
MKFTKLFNIFVLFVCSLSLLLFSCEKETPPVEIKGAVNGIIIWGKQVTPPCLKAEWPPDTCMFVDLYDINEKRVEKTLPFPCKFVGEWPPDTCGFEFLDVALGQYKLVVVAADSTYLTDSGLEGCKSVIGYYADPENSTQAGIIEVSKKRSLITRIEVIVGEQESM